MSLRSLETFVVASRKRKAIVVDHLAKIHHHVCWTTDYKMDPEWKPNPKYASYVQNQVGAMRCFRGHQDALRSFRDNTGADVALILEDDAVPLVHDWVKIAGTAAFHALDTFELVSLHGRAWHPDAFSRVPLPNSGASVLEPKKQGEVWVQGSLAYLIRRDAADRFIDATYDGYPSDLFICNRFKFALIDPSPFHHDRSAGSLIDCKTPTD